MYNSLNISAEKLAEWGIQDHVFRMVLYAMLEENYTFDESVQVYADYTQKEAAEVLREMAAAVDKAVEESRIAPTPRMLAEACYATAT